VSGIFPYLACKAQDERIKELEERLTLVEETLEGHISDLVALGERCDRLEGRLDALSRELGGAKDSAPTRRVNVKIVKRTRPLPKPSDPEDWPE